MRSSIYLVTALLVVSLAASILFSDSRVLMIVVGLATWVATQVMIISEVKRARPVIRLAADESSAGAFVLAH